MTGVRVRRSAVLPRRPILALALAALACTQATPPEVDRNPPTGYEAAAGEPSPAVLRASDLLKPDMLKGQYFQVDEGVRNDGLTDTYVVHSPYGTVEAIGDDQLRYRENEMEVLGALDEYGVSQPVVFGLGVVNGAENYVEGAAQLIVWPVRSLANVPEGMWNYGSQVAEMTRERRTSYEDSYAEELIGFSQAKRDFAGRLGVDPYTTNLAMQSRMNELSWPAWGGGMLASFGTAPVAGLAGYMLTATSMPENMHLVNLDKAPEDLRIANRRLLKAMGVGHALREQFLNHPWYSPRHQTILIESLNHVHGTAGRRVFVQVAVGADDEPEAFQFQRLSELLRAYHEYASPIREINAPDGLIVGRAEDDSAVVPLLIDYGRWTPGTQALVEALEHAIRQTAPDSRKIFWVTGRLSPEMTAELRARGWQVEENIFERHLLAYEYQELMAIKDILYGERIFPRIGD